MLNKILEEIRTMNYNEYNSFSGKKCYRTFGSLQYYFVLCDKYNLKPKCVNYLVYNALGKGFELEYCEHDIILAID